MASPPIQGGAAGGSEPVSATFSTSGGTVTASCQASTVDPVSASQPDGNTVAVLSPGPSDVEVDFTATARRSLRPAGTVTGPSH